MDPEILKMAKDARKRLIQQDAQFQRNLRADSLFTPELKKRMEEDTKRTHQSWLNRKVNDAIQEYATSLVVESSHKCPSFASSFVLVVPRRPE